MNRIVRSAAFALAASAMLLRAFLPLGWMPSSDARAPLIICPMMGGMMPAAPVHHGVPRHQERFCPFTAALAQLFAPAAPLLLSLPVQKTAARNLPAVISTVMARPYRPQAPRGPPLPA